MNEDFASRIAALSPEQRALLELRIRGRKQERGADPRPPAPPSARSDASARINPRGGQEMKFSLFFFADNGATEAANKYQLLVECAKFADQHGFSAIWTPERHFSAFGGLYPNPSVTAAALAMVTRHVQLRAGSVVLPLQHPLRVAEEWATVDNLSGGRVGVAFASGWHADDFVLAPEAFARRRQLMFDGLRTIQGLWRGEAVKLRNGVGAEVEVRIFPNPLQRELPVWVTATSAETFVKAGEIGAHVLTGLMEQGVEGCAEKIGLYRESLERNGYGAGHGQVAVMLHTYIGEDLAEVRAKVRAPFCNYLRSFLRLSEKPAPGVDVETLIPKQDQEALLNYSFERYSRDSALLGTPETCREIVERLEGIGVDEIACLLDFGLEAEAVLAGLSHLCSLKDSR